MTTLGRPSAPPAPSPARLRPGDLASLASIGLRTRKLRAGLSALGIAIGVAAIVAVLGLAASSQAALLAEIARLGTNLLTVTNGQTLTGGTAELPEAAPGMLGRLPGVFAVVPGQRQRRQPQPGRPALGPRVQQRQGRAGQLYGVIAKLEALGLELLEIRYLPR